MAWLNAFLQPSTHPENTAKVPYLPKRVRQFGWLVFLGITQGMTQLFLPEPGQAAEKIVIHYGSFNGSISLDELEASLGAVQSKPAHASRLPMPMPPEASSRLQALLTKPLPFLSPEQTDHLFRSPSGTVLLEAVADVFLVGETVEQGAANLRAALVGAAASGQGVTGLNLLRHFPGDIHWDARRTMLLLQRQEKLNLKTGHFLAKLDQGLEQQLERTQQEGYGREVAQPWEQEDLRLRGSWSYRQAALQLWDEQRDRRFLAQLYLPEVDAAAKQLEKAIGETIAARTADQTGLDGFPLVVMSHGLAANRRSRSFLAEHLASHGIAVAMVQHPGSDSEQFHGLLQGEAEDVASVQSFIDRPQDIRFLLDELGRLSQTNSVSRGNDGLADGDDRGMLAGYPLELEQVAIFGHSFGAYTALALAGAEINFAQLREDCEAEAMLLDLSLVLQCQARLLESQPMPQLKDERVVALMLADPVSRSIFGPEELKKVKLPVVWTGGERDRFTPFSLSQLPSFQWLGSEDKHLAIAEATSHVYLQPPNDSQGDAADQANLTEQVAPHPQAVQDYTNALGLAFIRTYLHRDRRYQAYLAAPYGLQLSQAPYHLRLWSPNGATAQQSLSQR